MGADWEPRVAALREWLYRDELAHSRLLWRLENDARRDDPWPYPHLWHDPAGAVLVDLNDHPLLGDDADLPWYQADADDPAALELLLALWLPPRCAVLLDQRFADVLARLGRLEPDRTLDVYHCPVGQLGEAALPCEPVRLTQRHRSLVAEDDWRPDDLAEECDETRGGVRYALIRGGHLATRLLLQPVSDGLVEIADLHTRPDRRRRGYAASLVQQVVRRAHEKGLGVTYSVHPSNLPSVQLAQQVGFRYAFTWERYRLTRS